MIYMKNMKLREERKEQDGRAVMQDLEMKLPPKKPMHLNQLKNTNFLKMYNSKNPIHETDRENKLQLTFLVEPFTPSYCFLRIQNEQGFHTFNEQYYFTAKRLLKSIY